MQFFQLAVGAGVALLAAAFHLAVRATDALRAVAFQLAVGAGVALRAPVFHLAVKAGVALRAVLFQLAVGAGGALHTISLFLSMRAPFPSHRVSCPTVSRRFHVRPQANIASSRVYSPRLCPWPAKRPEGARHDSAERTKCSACIREPQIV